MTDRHTEFFGPDLGRGPFASSNPSSSALQIATMLAQLRAPVQRDDQQILDHADYIRQVADTLYPDQATFVAVETEDLSGLNVVTFRTNSSSRTLLRIWMTDSFGGPPRTFIPTTIVVTGAVIAQDPARASWEIATNDVGVAQINVTLSQGEEVYWGVARGQRIFYAGPTVGN